MENTEIRPCPFCGSLRITVCIDKKPEGKILAGSEFAFCYCKGCGCRGHWAFKVDWSDQEISQHVIKLWNEDNAYYKNDSSRSR